MPNIFLYINYRDYLSDSIKEKKRENPSFSFQVFADKAGFKSKSFIKLVIDGKKNLSESSLQKINAVLKLNEKQFCYFSDLVSFNQASSIKLRNMFFEKLCSYTKKNSLRLIQQQHYEFYANWYHNTIRELVTMVAFNEDYELLGKLVKPQIPARLARESVLLLEKLGLIRKAGELYEQTDTLITTGDEVQSLAVHNFHLQNMVVAGESLDSSPSNERDISCLIVGLSDEGFMQYKKEIQEFRKKLLSIAQTDKNCSRVYHLNFHLFPTSRRVDEVQL